MERRATKKQLDYVQTIADTLNIRLEDNMTSSQADQFIKDHQKDFYNVQNDIERNLICENVKITDYAQELGFTLKKVGRYFTLKEHDSVRINPDKNVFIQNATGMKGTVIDFAKTFSGRDIKDIMQDFSARVHGMSFTPSASNRVPEEHKTKELQLPEKDNNMRNVFAYLTLTRYIDPDVVQYFKDGKMLYQDIHKNCVFVSYDNDKPVYGCLRGTNTYKRFVGDCVGNDYKKGFYINNGADKLIVTESVIDAMSVMSVLKAQGKNLDEYDYIPLAGVAKYDTLMEHLQEKYYKQLYLGLDNDEAGLASMKSIREAIAEKGIDDITITDCIPLNKDWNEEIKQAFLHGQSLQDINFFQKSEMSYMNLAKLEAQKTNVAAVELDNGLEMRD